MYHTAVFQNYVHVPLVFPPPPTKAVFYMYHTIPPVSVLTSHACYNDAQTISIFLVDLGFKFLNFVKSNLNINFEQNLVTHSGTVLQQKLIVTECTVYDFSMLCRRWTITSYLPTTLSTLYWGSFRYISYVCVCTHLRLYCLEFYMIHSWALLLSFCGFAPVVSTSLSLCCGCLCSLFKSCYDTPSHFCSYMYLVTFLKHTRHVFT